MFISGCEQHNVQKWRKIGLGVSMARAAVASAVNLLVLCMVYTRDVGLARAVSGSCLGVWRLMSGGAVRTAGGDVRRVEVTGQQRVGQVTEELFEQCGHVVSVVIGRQQHVTTSVELVT